MTIINLTPHPIRIYGWNVPDRIQIDGGEHTPVQVIPPSGTVARIGEIELGGQPISGCPLPVEYVEYRHATGLPDAEHDGDRYTTWYVVSLALALGRSDRGDLLAREAREQGLQLSVVHPMEVLDWSYREVQPSV